MAGGIANAFGNARRVRLIDLIIIGFVSAIGFTVSLFVATVAFDAGPVQMLQRWVLCLVLLQLSFP